MSNKKDSLLKALDSILGHARPRAGGGSKSSPGEFKVIDIEALVDRLDLRKAIETPAEQLDPKTLERCQVVLLLASLPEESCPYGLVVESVERVKRGIAFNDAKRAQQAAQSEHDELVGATRGFGRTLSQRLARAS